jgi:hypothetical protein
MGNRFNRRELKERKDMSKTKSDAQRSACPTSLHAGQPGVANEVLLQVRVEGALTAQPGESSFCLLTQMNLRRVGFSCVGLLGAFDFDLDEVGARRASGPGFGIHAAGRDQLGLGELVGGEDFQDGGEILIGEVMGSSAEQPTDVALGEAAPPGQVALIEMAALGLALEGDAEVAHFFGLRVP